MTEDWCATIQCFADTQPGWQEKSVEVQYRGAGLTGKVSLRLPSAYIGDPEIILRVVGKSKLFNNFEFFFILVYCFP